MASRRRVAIEIKKKKVPVIHKGRYGANRHTTAMFDSTLYASSASFR